METLTSYNSIHEGPAIDAAVTRASEGGSIDAAIQAKPNPNLLDNWYFGNPVNQRGQTSYIGTGYGIDRWFISSGISMVVNNDGTVTLTNNGNQNGIKVYQPIEAIPQNIPHTMSILATEVTGTVLMYLQESGGSYDTPISGKKISAGLTKETGTPTPSKSYRYQCILTLDAGSSVTLKAAKLELGTQQTLAHQDADGNWILNEIPDYGEQLRRCQRYFCRFNFDRNDLFFGSLSTNLDKAWITIPTPVVMRTAPSVSFSTTFNVVIRGNGFQLEALASNSTVAADTSTIRCCNILITPNTKPSEWTAQQVVMIYTSSSWYMDCSADL